MNSASQRPDKQKHAAAKTGQVGVTNGHRERRRRRTKAEIERIRQALYETLERSQPATVRQTFYLLTTQGVVEKTEAEYKGTVVRLLGAMRRAGEIPFSWVADHTRWMRKPRTFSSVEEALRRTAQTYRRALWDNQTAYVEIWTEKDALAGVLLEETDPWDVPLMVSRGFSSITYLYEAAQAIQEQGKPAYLYYFGDHDPSGVHIDRTIERRLREFAPEAEIYFERVAVRVEQIQTWQLPTRPTKTSDGRSKNFVGASVEVDAVPPDKLRQLASDCIARHLDSEALRRMQTIEEQERRTLQNVARRWSGRAG
jgi:hypothetical protein